MKNKINLWILAVAALTMSACSESFLGRDPLGGTILQDQYDGLSNTVEGSVRGIYSLLYNFSNHDTFGKRSIDLSTDILSGDVALTDKRYGWFYTDEQGMTYTSRSSYVWGHYYLMMRNINKSILQISKKSEVLDKIAEFGLPEAGSLEIKDANDSVVCTFSEDEATVAGYYAQALALRGYVYAQLVQLYCPPAKYLTGGGLDEVLIAPIYTETNLDSPQPLATAQQLYDQVTGDLEGALELFTAFEPYLVRESKLRIDANVARGILAYAYLNRANSDRPESQVNKEAYTRAVELVDEVIATGEYRIIPNKELLTTGFNDVNEQSWMWGQDVTVETATGLGSWFGQVDIHSYSYAWAGDTKACDMLLYDSVLVAKYPWDGRVDWFRSKKDPAFALCPDGKFFSAKSPLSTKQDDIDREWLSDNVFMRIESMYLIAAEASYRIGNDDAAIKYLTAITDERLNLKDPTAADSYGNFKNRLSHSNLLSAIYDNWRIELWGEGYGLQTFRRLGGEMIDDGGRLKKPGEKTRGGNHDDSAGSAVQPSESKYTFQIPGAETTYNPEIDK